MKTVIRNQKPKTPPVKIIKTVDKLRIGVDRLQKSLVPPPVAVLEMICGSWISQSIAVIAKLGVADFIPDEGASIEYICANITAHPESLYRLMRALTVVRIFEELPESHFKLTNLGKCLRSDHPQSMRYMAIFQGCINWSNWGALDHCIRTGQNAAEHIWGEKPFEHLARNKDKAEIFDKAMINLSKMELDSILGVYDFSKFDVIADIGGGYGAFLASILAHTPNSGGILFDLPHVTSNAQGYFAKNGLDDRVKIETGSFFDTIPAGADAYMMKHIIHDWSDDECIKILENVRAKIPADGTLLIFETVVPPANEAHYSKLLDLEMLVVTTGKERTELQFKDLLAKAGFRLGKITPTISMASIIEATPT